MLPRASTLSVLRAVRSVRLTVNLSSSMSFSMSSYVRQRSEEELDADIIAPPEKKPRTEQKKKKTRKPSRQQPDDVLWHDIVDLLGKHKIEDAEQRGSDWESPFEFREEIDVVVHQLSSNGHALALAPEPRSDWVIVAPFALPGERIRVGVYRHSRLHSFADLLSVESPNPEWRDDSRIQCKYFGKCSGCQYQMLSYEKQLELKRDVVIKAYQNFSDLPASAVPTVLPTIGSPKQYHYRTKITPHFEAPPKKARAQHTSEASTSISTTKPDWLKIGFNEIGKRTVMDIEECPIATPVLNKALGPIRQNIIDNIWSYKKGVSLLLRDSLDPSIPIDPTNPTPDDPSTHICITDPKATVRERVGNTYFEFPGHAFFQNNNSILVPLISYVRDAIFPPPSPDITPTPTRTAPTHLVDTYCGSGLFSIMLSPHFTTLSGIELSASSIASATANATSPLNAASVPTAGQVCTFLAGDASDIFATVSHFPRAQTAVIVDPPRKGCDERFVEQVVRFGAGTVVYVSCNVHTQARDVGRMVRLSEEEVGVGVEGKRYVVESLRGFDLFPQTAHVESVAVLRLVDSSSVG